MRSTLGSALVLLWIVTAACNPEAMQPNETSDSHAAAGAGAAAEVEKGGCSYVEWCDKPNDSHGSVCIQTGCSHVDALYECTREVMKYCGTPVDDWWVYWNDRRPTLHPLYYEQY